MGYPDYPIPEQESSYVAGTDIHNYLKTFADDFKVREHIRFRHHVIRVRPIESTRWEVIIRFFSIYLICSWMLFYIHN